MLNTKSLPPKPIVHEETGRIPNMEESNEIVIDDFDSLDEIYIGSELKTISYNEAEEEEEVELQVKRLYIVEIENSISFLYKYMF